MFSVALFWVIALAIVSATLVVLARPLLRGGKPTGDDAPPELDATTAVYRDQKRQLDADLAAGAITTAEHTAAQEELVHRLSAEIAKRPSATEAGEARTPWVAIVVLVAIVPVTSVLLYELLGNPAGMKAEAPAAPQPQFSQEDVRAMVEKLAQRMRANPDDPKGWILLARSYAAMGRFAEASDAFAEAAKRMPDDAQLYADWADAAAMAQQRKLVGKPEELVARALALDPNNRKALALSATALLERGNIEGSLARWRELRQKLASGSDEALEIDRVIAEISGSPTATSPAPEAKAPSTRVPAQSAGALGGRIDVDPKIASRIAPDDTVFVLARSAEGGRVPLAVMRIHGRELPATFHLDDSMGMVPEMKLSATPRVIVEARVSKSGNAKASAGDLRGTSAPVAPGDGNVHIVINEVVP
ncbi:MAG TPA: c-type cytochrome biogenesis protein CcmI [Casimicrobiaceae bacterium]